jgi:uncharacterized membrane protein
MNSMGLISGEDSGLYYMASRYLLPASLVLLTLSIDLKAIINLGPKAIIMFLSGTFALASQFIFCPASFSHSSSPL